MNNIELPSVITGPNADRLDLRNQPKKKDDHSGHFLALIAFDGNITCETMDAVMLIQQHHKAWRGWKFHMGEGQVRSRNECVNEFLHKTPCSHMLFLDSDVIPRAEHILGLRKHPEAADAIICGLYAKKQPDVEYPYNSLPGGDEQPNARHLIEIAKGPTGCMQIPRSAFFKIQAKFPERFYKCDYDMDRATGKRADRYSFFFHDIRMDRELHFMRDQSEDWAFCEMAREAGVKIYADLWTTACPTEDRPPIMHRGRAYFPLPTELERKAAVQELEEAQKQIAELEKKLADSAAALTQATTSLAPLS